MDTAERVRALREAAEIGGDAALAAFRTVHDVETKGGQFDRVTETDRAVQRAVASVLRGVAADPLVGEEENALKTVPDGGPAWVVDPIDGTNNYVAGDPTWAVALAATEEGEPAAAVTRLPAVGDVYVAGDDGVTRNDEPVAVTDRDDPGSFTVNPVFGFSPEHRRRHRQATETIFSAFGDIRRVGCAGAAFARVASGELDAAVSTVRLDPWDSVGGVHLIREAGGTVTDLDGNRWRPGATGLLASNGNAHHALVDAFGANDRVGD